MFRLRRGRDAIEPSPVFDDVWKVYTEIGGFERHFNDLQARYRGLASTWLLAAFGGIGFVLSKDISTPPLDAYFLAAGIALAGAIGITLLWNLDQMVYFSLLESAFRECVLMEQKHGWLPPIRNNMRVLAGDQGVRRRTAAFYVAGVVILLVIASAFTAAGGMEKNFDLSVLLAIAVAGLVVIANWSAYMWRSSLQQDWRSYSIRHAVNIDAPVETVFQWLTEGEKVATWATNIKGLSPQFSGRPSEGAQWLVTPGKSKKFAKFRATPIRTVETFDEPYGLTVRFAVPGKRVRRFYRLRHVAAGSELSVSEQRYGSCLTNSVRLIFEPLWIITLPVLPFIQYKRKRLLRGEMGELKRNVEHAKLEIRGEDHITDQYAEAVIRLSSSSGTEQLEGIDALRRVLSQSEKYHASIVKILAAFIRVQSSRKNSDVPQDHSASVSEALKVLRHRPHRQEAFRIDLHGADLKKAELAGVRLRGALLAMVDLEEAMLQGADLAEADLCQAKLMNAHLDDGCLRGASLERADLTEASLCNADLEETLLGGAILENARIPKAQLGTSFDLAVGQVRMVKEIDRETRLSAHLAEDRIIARKIKQAEKSKHWWARSQ